MRHKKGYTTIMTVTTKVASTKPMLTVLTKVPVLHVQCTIHVHVNCVNTVDLQHDNISPSVPVGTTVKPVMTLPTLGATVTSGL